jgi:hypothetical protein
MKLLPIIIFLLSMAGISLAQSLPENASPNPFGQGWICERGFYKSGQKCIKVQPPENASINYLGNGWECNRGYYKSGQKCLKVQVPENASINYLGNGWECNKGYYKSGQKCLKVQIPENASINSSGNGWDCNKGYKKSGNSCVVMSALEMQKQKELEQALIEEVKPRKALGVSGDDCETEYKTNAEVCVEITGGDLDCNESYGDKYYSDCDVTLNYEIQTNYEGGSYLDVDVECRVGIEYNGRQIYTTQTDSGHQDESHILYAYGSESETMSFNFSFGTYEEITNVKINSAECEIESVDLY